MPLKVLSSIKLVWYNAKKIAFLVSWNQSGDIIYLFEVFEIYILNVRSLKILWDKYNQGKLLVYLKFSLIFEDLTLL